MKIFPHGDPQMIFLGAAGVGHNCGQIAPQVVFFDAFYVQSFVVGFHILGDSVTALVIGYHVTGSCGTAQIVGFSGGCS